MQIRNSYLGSGEPFLGLAELFLGLAELSLCLAEPYPGVAEPILNSIWAWPTPFWVCRTLSGLGPYRRLFVVPGHEGCEGPDRGRLRLDMDSALSFETNQGWVTLSIIETRFLSFLPKKNEAR